MRTKKEAKAKKRANKIRNMAKRSQKKVVFSHIPLKQTYNLYIPKNGSHDNCPCCGQKSKRMYAPSFHEFDNGYIPLDDEYACESCHMRWLGFEGKKNIKVSRKMSYIPSNYEQVYRNKLRLIGEVEI